jgi:hypothetical protein
MVGMARVAGVDPISDIACGRWTDPATLISEGIAVHDVRVMFDTLKARVAARTAMLEEEFPRCTALMVPLRLLASISLSAEERDLHLIAEYPTIVQRVAQRHISSYLGITPEALSRIRGRIEKHPGDHS